MDRTWNAARAVAVAISAPAGARPLDERHASAAAWAALMGRLHEILACTVNR